MLSKKHRLTTSEVRAILQRGRSVRSQTLSAKFVPAASSKAAVVVKTSIAKSAVARNRLRRSAYDTLQECLPKKVHSVFFLHSPTLNTNELIQLCSKLS